MAPLQISDKLYGRDREINSLNESFTQICRGEGRIVILPGHSGTGKTSLVHTLRTPIVERNGWYTHGKFNQYQRGLPYFAIRQALGNIWSIVEDMSDAGKKAILGEIQEQIGEVSYLLADLIPDIRRHINIPEKADGISPQEARHRFTRIIHEFLKVVCKPEHPVMIFMDDWQWADHASLDLLRELDVGGELRYLLLVLSYRDDEVGHDHPLRPVLSDLKRMNRPVSTLPIQELNQDSIRDFIAGNLTPQVCDLDKLTDMAYCVTGGNPFYARSYLEYLDEFGFLRFDEKTKTWTWSVGDDANPAHIVDLFGRRMNQFNDGTKRVLALAACLGSAFDLETLALCAQTDLEDVLSSLRTPLASGMVVEIKQELDGIALETGQRYRFSHDRVQEAAFQLIPSEEITQVHLGIGRRMLDTLETARMEPLLFEIADHMNHGASLIESDPERIAVIRLNVSAAQKAQEATAYSAMLEYFRAAASLSGYIAGGMTGLAEIHHDLAIQILQGLGESEFLEGVPQAGEEAVHQAVELADGPIERAEVLNVLIVNYTLQARYNDAIAAGRKALCELGIDLPVDGFDEARDRIIAEVREAIGERDILSLADSPVMTDPAMLTATKLLITMGPPCYRTHQRLWSVMVPLVVRITVEYGVIPQIGYSHTAFGGLLGWVENNYRDAKDFGEAAIRVMRERFDTPSYQSIFYLMVGSSTRHWFHHMRASTGDYQRAYEIGLRSGNLQYAAYGFGHDMYCCFFQGVSMDSLITQSRQSLLFSKSRMNVWAIDLLEGGIRLFDLLRQHSASASNFLDDQAYRDQIEEHHNIQVQCIYQIMQSQCLMVIGDYQAALTLSLETDELVYTVGTQGLLPWPEHVFTRYLLLAATYCDAPVESQAGRRQEMQAILAQLATWETYAPENYRHKHLLALAEHAGLFNPCWDVLLGYDQAISEALRGGFLHWAAYGYERAGKFLKSMGQDALAQMYWLESYRCYGAWGAHAKCSQLLTAISEQAIGLAPGPLGDSSPAIRNLIRKQHSNVFDRYVCIEQLSQEEKERTEVLDELAQATERLRIEIRKHKRTESRLRESQRLLMATQEIGKIGGWALYLDDMELRWTKETFAIFDLVSDQEPDLQRALSYYMPDSEAIISKAVDELIASSIPFNLELQIRTEKGAIRDVHVIGEHAHDENVVYGVIQDVTEQVKLERQLQQSEKMRAVGQLAGGIAHDFNNQLCAVLGYADILNHRISDPVLKEYCENILVGARRSADLTKQLLAFSRKGQYTYKKVHVHKLLGEVISILSHSIDKGISFRQNLGAYPDIVMGDESQLQNVILNLALNARDAMPDGGVITFHTESTASESPCSKWPESEANGGCFRLNVEDTGVGMDEERQSHIFEPFYTTKGVGEGTGMGLAAAYGTVQNHGGCICVKSELGQGSRFSICLPMCDSEDMKDKPSPDQDMDTTSFRVMVVDDEESVCNLIKDYLEGAGHRPVDFQDGSEALAYYRDCWQEIDLIILDVIMPGLCGKDVFKELREVNPDALVVLASGYSIDGEAREIMEMGAHCFLQKPFDKQDLDKALHSAASVLSRD